MKQKLFTLFLVLVASAGIYVSANQVWPIIMDNTTATTVQNSIVTDFRENNVDRFLYNWSDTYITSTPTDENFYGNNEGYIAYTVGSYGWSGAGLYLTDTGNSWQAAESLRAAIVANPSNYFFHLAIKSTDSYSHEFRILDEKAAFVLGSNSMYGARIYGDFVRNGKWQEIIIPMTYFASNLSNATFDANHNIFEMLTEAIPGAQLNLDAVYICDAEFEIDHPSQSYAEINNLKYALYSDRTASVVRGNYESLTNVTIPEQVLYQGTTYTVNQISWNAFTNFSNLTSIVMQATTPPGLSATAFAGCNASIYVPCGSLEVYQTTSGWSNYVDKIKYPSLPRTKGVNNGVISIPQNSTVCDDAIEITAIPNRGCQFIQWSDGTADNPRTVTGSQADTISVTFDYSLIGKCGKDSALIWRLDTTTMALHITGSGALSENYTYGKFIESLTIGNEIISIGHEAFSCFYNLKNVIIGSSVKVFEQEAFESGYSIETITCYGKRPPTINYRALEINYSTIVYVPADYLETYKMHDAWGLYDVRPLGANTTETTEVTVTPAENTVDVVWPVVSGAATYELVIKDKVGNVICTLIFNANGQLTQIAFGAPARGNSAQQTQGVGFAFTVTGLDSGTGYDLTITAKDSNGSTLNAQTVSFTTKGESQTPTEVAPISSEQPLIHKVMIDGKILILRGDKVYTVTGQEVK